MHYILIARDLPTTISYVAGFNGVAISMACSPSPVLHLAGLPVSAGNDQRVIYSVPDRRDIDIQDSYYAIQLGTGLSAWLCSRIDVYDTGPPDKSRLWHGIRLVTWFCNPELFYGQRHPDDQH